MEMFALWKEMYTKVTSSSSDLYTDIFDLAAHIIKISRIIHSVFKVLISNQAKKFIVFNW